MKKITSKSDALQLKITLLDLQPEVWRRVVVPAYFTLFELHCVLQEVMPWGEEHMHQFKKGHNIYSFMKFDYVDKDKQFDESTIALDIPFPRVGSKIEYEYDFGDGWRHEIKLEKKLKVNFSESLQCLEGKMASPPEDCGGVWGYIDMLEAVKDPNHPEHAEKVEWLGEKFDPEFFDIKKANSRLKKRFKQKTVRGWSKEGSDLHA